MIGQLSDELKVGSSESWSDCQQRRLGWPSGVEAAGFNNLSGRSKFQAVIWPRASY